MPYAHYTLARLMARLSKAKNHPPEWAENTQIPAVYFFEGNARLRPNEVEVFVETDGGSARLESVRFERHNGSICVVLSSHQFDKEAGDDD